MSQNAFLDLRKLRAKKKFTPKIFGLKTALDFFFGNHLPSADGKRSVKSDSNNSKLIEAKVSRSFDEMVEIDYGGDDFHDPTINVRRRCALAIAKPTPRGY